MGSTTSTEKLATLGQRRGEYCGAGTALVFSDPGREFAVLRSGCGVYDLAWRRYFRVSGRDRVRWLNGMVSNNIRDLAAGQGIYAFVLNPQGHILGDLYVYNRGDYFVLETDAAQAEKLYSHLKRFIIMDQVEFLPAQEWFALGVQGPKADEILRAAGFKNPALQPLQVADVDWNGAKASLVHSDDQSAPGYQLWLDSSQAASAWDALTNAGATPAGTEALEMARIAAGIPRYGQDIRERDLPQETGQMRALSFTKGCYIGQEIVERIRARGKLHRGFTGFRISEGRSLPVPGAKVQSAGKEVGEITSATQLPGKAQPLLVALGYIRTEAGGPGTSVDIGSCRATVETLPFTPD